MSADEQLSSATAAARAPTLATRLARWLAGSVAAGALLLAVHARLDRDGIVPPPVLSERFDLRLRSVEDQLGAPAARAGPAILLIGDSMLFHGFGELGFRASSVEIETDLAEDWRGEGAPPRVVTLATFGFGYTSFYFLADEIVRMRPDAVLLELNPATQSEWWRSEPTQSRPELSRFVRPSRLGETLALPLRRVGLTADRLLWGVTSHGLGLDGVEGAVRDEQLRFAVLLDHLAEGAQHRVGSDALASFREARFGVELARMEAPGRPRRPSVELVHRRLEGLLDGGSDDDPILPFLRLTLERLEGAGIPVQVFVPPFDLEHFAGLGVLDTAAVEANLERLRGVVERAGSGWLDLHASLSDRYFDDPLGHLTYSGDDAGTVRLARRLAPFAREGLERAR